jgi:hypothetical protein
MAAGLSEFPHSSSPDPVNRVFPAKAFLYENRATGAPWAKLFRPTLAAAIEHDYNFVKMAKRIRQGLNSILVTAALVFSVASYSPAEIPGGRPVLRAAEDQGHGGRTRLSMQTAALPPGLTIPPLDAAVPAHTETATFALG